MGLRIVVIVVQIGVLLRNFTIRPGLHLRRTVPVEKCPLHRT